MISKESKFRIDLPVYQTSDIDGAFSENNLNLVFNYTNQVTHAGPVGDFRRLIAQGSCATSDLSGVRFRIESRPGSMYFRQRYTGPSPTFTPRTIVYTAYGNFIRVASPDLTPDLTPSAASDQAIVRFYQAADRVSTTLQGMVVAGEMRSTLRMIQSPAKALRQGLTNYLSHVKKRGPRVPRRHRRRFLSESWLEYSFGWVPLINDIEDGMKALSKGNPARAFAPVSGFAENKRFTNGSPVSYNHGPMSVRFLMKKDESSTVRYFGVVYTDVETPAYLKASNYGFKPSLFIPTLWELVPYSFLVDYFTNIGDVLFAWSFHRRSLKWASKTTRSVVRYESHSPVVTRSPVVNNFKKDQHLTPGHVRWERSTVDRIRDADLYTPSVRFEIPGFSSLKWLNLAALGRAHSSARKALNT